MKGFIPNRDLLGNNNVCRSSESRCICDASRPSYKLLCVLFPNSGLLLNNHCKILTCFLINMLDS